MKKLVSLLFALFALETIIISNSQTITNIPSGKKVSFFCGGQTIVQPHIRSSRESSMIIKHHIFEEFNPSAVHAPISHKEHYQSMLSNTEWCSAYRGFEDPVLLSSFTLDGDTLINNVSYKKIHRSGAYLREDGDGKVYIYSPINSSQDVLWYDFSLQVGEEFTGLGNVTCIVTHVDTFIDLEGLARKRLYLQKKSVEQSEPIVWIEGFGNIYCVNNPTYVDKEHQAVVCIKRGQEVCYEHDFLGKNCDDFDATNLLYTKSELLISPNPVRETLHVHFEEDLSIQIKVYSMRGELILSGDGCSLDVSSLANGIYLLVCQKGDKTMIGKFLKE